MFIRSRSFARDQVGRSHFLELSQRQGCSGVLVYTRLIACIGPHNVTPSRYPPRVRLGLLVTQVSERCSTTAFSRLDFSLRRYRGMIVSSSVIYFVIYSVSKLSQPVGHFFVIFILFLMNRRLVIVRRIEVRTWPRASNRTKKIFDRIRWIKLNFFELQCTLMEITRW